MVRHMLCYRNGGRGACGSTLSELCAKSLHVFGMVSARCEHSDLVPLASDSRLTTIQANDL
jgi:hypothetical protein